MRNNTHCSNNVPRRETFPWRGSALKNSCLLFPGMGEADCLDTRHSCTDQSALHADEAVREWLAERRDRSRLQVRTVPLDQVARWRIDPETGNLDHESGRFYSITGVKVRHRHKGGEIEWDQPIIDQPEVGILGILAKRIGGLLHFCLQAKEEPGNIGAVQLSPTVQATYSNYSLAHGGALPPFLEWFLDPPRERVVFAKLQTEDGGRFLLKSNRNMIVLLDDAHDDALPDGFIWLTLRQIALLLQSDNLIHACTRSVLAALPFTSSLHREWCLPALKKSWPLAGQQHDGNGSLSATVQWLDDQKAANHMLVKRVGLNTLTEWGMDDSGFFAHRDSRFFRIMGLDVISDCREVPAWSQPILDNMETGIIGLLIRERGGRRSYLMQAKAEAGNRSSVQLGPTVQFTPGNYCGNEKLPKPYLFEEFCGKGDFPVLWQNWQAEEGARFYQEEHLHRILLLPEEVELPLPADFRWLLPEEVGFFLHLGESVNSCARSVLACLLAGG